MAMLPTACTMIVMWTLFVIHQVTARSQSTPKPTKTPQNEPKPKSSTDSAVIGGAVGGSIAVIIIVIVIVYCVWSRRRNRGQAVTKQSDSLAYNNNQGQPRAPVDTREPYTGLTSARDNVAQRNVYDELGGVSNTNTTSNTNEDAEYCYISDSDIIAAQRQSGVPIPSVRNNKAPAPGTSDLGSNPVPSSIKVDTTVRYNTSDVPSNEKLSRDFHSDKNMSLDDQTGSQQILSPPVNTEPHEYLVLEPELTSL